MNANPTVLRAPTLALCLLALACDSTSDAGKDTKAGKTEEATKKAEPKADAKEAKPTPKKGGKYRAGQLPPAGMSAEQLKEFAVDVGDPTGGELTLEQAFAGDADLGDKTKGTLTASFDTSMGSFDCTLYEEDAPMTVANFVGLARGTRPVYDKKEATWTGTKLFDGIIFHRVKKDFMIQTGESKLAGRNPGYVIADEFAPTLKHSSAGILSMANQEKPNTGNTQFFITVKATPHLDGKHAVFGKCPDAKVPVAISKVKVDARVGDRPYENVTINSVVISRKTSGKKKK